MVVRFANRANKAEDSRFYQADKQAADGVRSVKFGTLLAGRFPMTVRYALMNQGSETVEHELFSRAFAGVPGLTPIDAGVLGNPDCGMLIRKLTLEQGTALQTNLKAAGVETDVVPETALPALPEGKVIRFLECSPQILNIRDCLQRITAIGRQDLKLLAAGSIRIATFPRERKEVEVTRIEWVHGGHVVFPIVKHEIRVQRVEREAEQWVLRAEILVPVVNQRFIIEAENFNYRCLGSAMTHDLSTNFCLLIRELARSYSPPLLSRGVTSILGDPPEFAYYPNKDAFHNELVWLLWRATRVQGAVEK
jgi:hypothetical protein